MFLHHIQQEHCYYHNILAHLRLAYIVFVEAIVTDAWLQEGRVGTLENIPFVWLFFIRGNVYCYENIYQMSIVFMKIFIKSAGCFCVPVHLQKQNRCLVFVKPASYWGICNLIMLLWLKMIVSDDVMTGKELETFLGKFVTNATEFLQFVLIFGTG